VAEGEVRTQTQKTFWQLCLAEDELGEKGKLYFRRRKTKIGQW